MRNRVSKNQLTVPKEPNQFCSRCVISTIGNTRLQKALAYHRSFHGIARSALFCFCVVTPGAGGGVETFVMTVREPQTYTGIKIIERSERALDYWAACWQVNIRSFSPQSGDVGVYPDLSRMSARIRLSLGFLTIIQLLRLAAHRHR